MASNAAKSYIEAVMARADGATPGPWKADVDDDYLYQRLVVTDDDTHIMAESLSVNRDVKNSAKNFAFAAHARQDIPNLAKMLLRAIAALESIDDDDMRCCDVSVSEKIAHVALAEINAMAKGSQ